MLLTLFSYTKSFLWGKPFVHLLISLVSTSIVADFFCPKFVTTSTVLLSVSGFQCTRRFWRAFSPRRSISSWPVHLRLWPAREEWRATHSFSYWLSLSSLLAASPRKHGCSPSRQVGPTSSNPFRPDLLSRRVAAYGTWIPRDGLFVPIITLFHLSFAISFIDYLDISLLYQCSEYPLPD